MPDGFDLDEEETSLPFAASFNSSCGAGDDIEQGDEIVMWQGEAWHPNCAEEAGAVVRS